MKPSDEYYENLVPSGQVISQNQIYLTPEFFLSQKEDASGSPEEIFYFDELTGELSSGTQPRWGMMSWWLGGWIAGRIVGTFSAENS